MKIIEKIGWLFVALFLAATIARCPLRHGEFSDFSDDEGFLFEAVEEECTELRDE